MRALSVELRERVVAAFRTGKYTVNQIARIFGISRSAAQSYERRERTAGNLQPRKRKLNESAAFNDPCVHAVIIAAWEERNDTTLAEYCRAVQEQCGVTMSEAHMCRLLKKLDLRRKKNGSRYRTRQTCGAGGA
jgi:transposase